jgi:FkbM family methyltransferase
MRCVSFAAVSLSSLFIKLRFEASKNRFARWLNSNSVHERAYPHGWEPEVLECLCQTAWSGPVWDVGASLGRHAYRIARHHKVYAFEPNLNALQFLGYNLRNCKNVCIVPLALTLDGQPMEGSYHPDFMTGPTGPAVMTLSLAEALKKLGRPGVIKFDIEGGEYDFIKSELLADIPLVVEWHAAVPKELPFWTMYRLDDSHSLLRPKKLQ